MPEKYRNIYFKIIVQKRGVPAELTLDQMRTIPCHEIFFNELEEKFFEIRFKPQSGVTDEMVLQEHLRALRRKYIIRGHEVYDVKTDGLIGGR